MEVKVHRKPFGDSIEALVCAFLEQQNLRCIAKNFSCRLGEVDLIMLEPADNTLVFVEVRFRANAGRGTATESVDWKKQRKLRRTALYYLQKHANALQAARIDVIGVSYRLDETANEHVNGVSYHLFQNHGLVWTRNAVEEC
ncbi:UNVERIFIED_CONTAM: hypothetical protein GTU68_030779 [Idotea baltica]|nr:hypothetical protein [Idotea baltica]